jgi:hypothetical protein
MPRIDRTPIPDEVFREVAEQIVASEQRADPTPPSAPPIEVLRAARDWAAEHRHQIPDDRLIAIVYAAGRTAAAEAIRAKLPQIMSNGTVHYDSDVEGPPSWLVSRAAHIAERSEPNA